MATFGEDQLGLEVVLVGVGRYLQDSEKVNQANRKMIASVGVVSSKSSAFTQLNQRIGALGAVATRAGGLLTAGLTAPITALAGFATKAASDLGEATNAAQQVFKGAAPIVQEFGRTSAKAFAISRRAAFEYTASLGAILKSSGFAEDAAARMSVRMVQLAGDLASFKNLRTEDAFDAIRSGLVGETEPLRRVGVLLNENAVKTRAYELGLAATGAELSEGQKVAARYSLILEQTRDAHGDVARTSGALANQQRILAARFEDTRAAIGQRLLPMATRLGTAALTLLDVLTALPRPAQNLALTLGIVLATAGPLLISFGLMASGVSGLVSSVGLLSSAFAFLVSPAGLVVLALAAIAAAVILAIIYHKEIEATATRVWSAIGEAASDAGRAIARLPARAGRAGLTLMRLILQGISQGGSAVLRALSSLVRAAIRILNPLNWVFGSNTIDAYREAGEDAGRALALALETALGRVEHVVPSLAAPIEAVRDAVNGLHSELARLLNLPTRESALEDLQLSRLRVRALKLEGKAEEERLDRERRLKGLKEGRERAQLFPGTEAIVADFDRQIAALEDSKGAAEGELEVVNKQIRALERLGEERRLEREALIARGQLADATLATDAEVIRAAENMIKAIANVTTAIASQTSNLQTAFIPAWATAAAETKTSTDEMKSAVGGAVDEMVGDVGAGFDDIGAEFDSFVNEEVEAFKADMKRQFNELVSQITAPFVSFKNFMGRNWQEILGVSFGIMGVMVTGLALNAFQIRDRVAGAIGEIPGRLRALGGGFRDAAAHLGGQLLDGLRGAVGGARGLAVDIAVAVGGAIKSFINREIIDRVNRALEFTIPLPGPIPDVQVNPPDIPRLHRGALDVPRDMLALIHKHEMVVPARLADLLRAAAPRPSLEAVARMPLEAAVTLPAGVAGRSASIDNSLEFRNYGNVTVDADPTSQVTQAMRRLARALGA